MSGSNIGLSFFDPKPNISRTRSIRSLIQYRSHSPAFSPFYVLLFHSLHRETSLTLLRLHQLNIGFANSILAHPITRFDLSRLRF